MSEGAGKPYETIYREAMPELVKVLTAIVRNVDEATELAQEAAIRLLRQPPGSVRDPRAFLFFAGANLAKDALRRAELEASHRREILHEPPMHADSAEAAHAIGRGLERIRTALGLLGDSARRVVWLARIEGRTNAETARALGLSEKTVEKHLARSIARLAACLRP